jgi:hypothetical protein
MSHFFKYVRKMFYCSKNGTEQICGISHRGGRKRVGGISHNAKQSGSWDIPRFCLKSRHMGYPVGAMNSQWDIPLGCIPHFRLPSHAMGYPTYSPHLGHHGISHWPDCFTSWDIPAAYSSQRYGISHQPTDDMPWAIPPGILFCQPAASHHGIPILQHHGITH